MTLVRPEGQRTTLQLPVGDRPVTSIVAGVDGRVWTTTCRAGVKDHGPTAPTLMVWGLEDTALSKETTDGTHEHVADLTLRFLPDVSHWVQQEAPEIVNAMLLAWLAGDPVPEAGDVVVDRLEEPAEQRST